MRCRTKKYIYPYSNFQRSGEINQCARTFQNIFNSPVIVVLLPYRELSQTKAHLKFSIPNKLALLWHFQSVLWKEMDFYKKLDWSSDLKDKVLCERVHPTRSDKCAHL